MMKLIIMALAVSDTGSVSISTVATDLPAPICQQLAAQGNAPTPEQVVNGHKIVIKSHAKCVPLGVPVAEIGPGPEAALTMFNGFLNNIVRR